MPPNATPYGPHFSIEQIGSGEAASTHLLPASLMARVATEYEEIAETLEMCRPRDPNFALWLLNPTKVGPVAIWGTLSGREWTAPTVEVALAWVVAVQRGELEEA